MINPVELTGMIQRTQDISAIKQNEDVKPQFEHVNIQDRTEQQAILNHEQVVEKDNADREKNNFDAKEKGNGVYYDINKKKRKKYNQHEEDGKVVKKSKNVFDVQA